MKLRNIPYLFRQGLRNLVRHKASSLFCLSIMLANIFLFCGAYALLTNINALVEAAQQSVGVTVFFNEELTEEEIREIGFRIGESEEVAKMVYTSAEQAWEEFRSVYFEGNEELAEGFAEDNPLAHSANYEIFLSDLSRQQDFVSWVESIDGVRKVNYSNVVAEGLSNVSRVIEVMALAVLGLLVVIAVSQINNSISLSIAMRKDELHIMRYVGATRLYIMTPFLLQGAVIGLVGALVPLAVVFGFYEPVTLLLSEKLSAFGSLIQFVSRGEVFALLVPAALLLGVGIGLLGSLFSIRKHIRV